MTIPIDDTWHTIQGKSLTVISGEEIGYVHHFVMQIDQSSQGGEGLRLGRGYDSFVGKYRLVIGER